MSTPNGASSSSSAAAATSNGVSSSSSEAGGGMSSPSTASGVMVAAGGGSHSGEDRLKELERLFADGPEGANEAKAFSTETLLDILLILFNECCNSSLRKEKTVTDFIEIGRTRDLTRYYFIHGVRCYDVISCNLQH